MLLETAGMSHAGKRVFPDREIKERIMVDPAFRAELDAWIVEMAPRRGYPAPSNERFRTWGVPTYLDVYHALKYFDPTNHRNHVFVADLDLGSKDGVQRGSGSGVSRLRNRDGSERHPGRTAMFYGAKHMLVARTQPNRKSELTVQFEIANLLPEEQRSQGRKFDHDNHLILQLMPEHLPAVAAVVLGYAPTVRFEHYGADHNKRIDVSIAANGSLLVTLRQGQDRRSIAIEPCQQPELADLLMQALKQRLPHLGETALLRTLHTTGVHLQRWQPTK